MAFETPPLPYDYKALEPHIDEQTMKIHHDKHHVTYTTKLNAALEKHRDWQGKKIEDILQNLTALPDDVRAAVRNHGGGHYNHGIFWKNMAPNGGGEPTGNFANAINSTFGSFSNFKEQFSNAAVNQFGSGWAWLSLDRTGGLVLKGLPNQDSPLSEGLTPILGLDVWEHAYYLKYQNRRPDYITAWWNVVNWDDVAERFAKARS